MKAFETVVLVFAIGLGSFAIGFLFQAKAVIKSLVVFVCMLPLAYLLARNIGDRSMLLIFSLLLLTVAGEAGRYLARRLAPA